MVVTYNIENMALLEKFLTVKESTIPGAGMGLFTKEPIPKGTRVIEYKGKVTSWKKADHMDGLNPYIFYVNAYHVIDTLHCKKSLARYANDAKGLKKIKGITNNCKFVIEDLRVFLEAEKNIEAGSEILVGYGQEYWDTVKKNYKLINQQEKSKSL